MGIFFHNIQGHKNINAINELQRKTNNGDIEDTNEHDNPDDNEFNVNNDDYSVQSQDNDNPDDNQPNDNISDNNDDQNTNDNPDDNQSDDDNNYELSDNDNQDDLNNTDQNTPNDENDTDDQTDDNFNINDSDPDNTDDNTVDDIEDPEQTDELQQLEDDLFSNLNDGQKKIKIVELKTLFVKMYHDADELINKINKIPKTEDNINILERIINTLSELKSNIEFYMVNTFKTLTYIQNSINLQKNMAIFNAIKEIFKEIEKKKE
jgi:hypothetical protein